MRRWMQSGLIAALAGVLLAGVAMGSDEPTTAPAEKGVAPPAYGERHEAKAGRSDFKPELRRITDLKGMKIKTEKDETFGTVENLIVDVDHGRVAYAVVSHGGLLGIGDKDVLLPFVTIQCKRDSTQLRTTATLEQFKQSEGFDDDNPELVRKLSDPAFAERFYRQFDVRPYWEEKSLPSQMKHEKTGAGMKGKTESLQASAEELARQEGYESESGIPAKRAGDTARKRGPGEMVSTKTLFGAGGVAIKTGVTIKTEDGVDAGDLDNLMVEVTRGHIAYAVVNREHSLVHENRLCAVPWELIHLRRAEPRPNLIVDLPVAKIKDAPGFPAGHWPDMTKMDWNEQINAYYNATPYYVIYGYVSSVGDLGPAHTIEGTILSVNRDVRGPGLDQAGIQVTLKVEKDQTPSGQTTEGQTVLVNLAPAQFLQDKGFTLKEGGKLMVTGFEAMPRMDQTLILAQEIRMDGKSVSLRSDQGEPMWSMQK
jgi:sporulation protein YlmC with PRC-barrel domain